MPPTWIRRPLSVTTWLILCTVLLILSPIALALSALVTAVTADRRPAIVTRIVIAYVIRELATLLTCGGLWILSGGGLLMQTRWCQTLHWRLLRWFVHGIAQTTLSTLNVRVAEQRSPASDEALQRDEPLLMFSRHAGPADTVLLIDRLLTQSRRRPSVVFKETIAFDPSVDLISHRLPHAVLDVNDRDECEARIRQIAGNLGPRGVLLLFPEGGNFTPERRRSALRSLRRRGRRAAAAQAQEMTHVLPPRPAGALAALAANPDAAVIFAAHTGLGLAAYPREIWRELPIGKTLYTRTWLVPRAEIPQGTEEQAAWLNQWWKRVDDWIDQRHLEG